MSVLQVSQISDLLKTNRIGWNRPWGGGPVVVPLEPGPAKDLTGGMRITILSPERSDLLTLAREWNKDRARRGLSPDSDEVAPAPEVLSENRPVGKSSFRRQDTGHGPPNVQALANSQFTDDRSVSNMASIAFLAELQGTSLLIGGDARAAVLCRSIAALLAQRGQERLHVDAFVVPHSGSRNNMSRELLALLECDKYMFSTDGSAFQHPHRETIARILVYGRPTPDRPLTLVFNYRTSTTEIWANPQLQSRYRYRAVYPEQTGAGIKIQL